MRYDFEFMDIKSLEEVLQQTDLSEKERRTAMDYLNLRKSGTPMRKVYSPAVSNSSPSDDFPMLSFCIGLLWFVFVVTLVIAIGYGITFFTRASHYDDDGKLLAVAGLVHAFTGSVISLIVIAVLGWFKRIGSYIINK